MKYSVSQAWSPVNPVLLIQLLRKTVPDLENNDLQGFIKKISASLKFMTCYVM